MSFGDFPDLGKIGKRVGKRLRDILKPPVYNGPSKEERLTQRLLDSLRGLVYFDNFDEVEKWVIDDIDPIQQANTPLLERAASQVYDQKTPTSRVLLCHDYSGGYHRWEGVRPVAVKEKPYSCNYFQNVETFVYFSHKLVCIPPAAWINACHRNGVKVLGTFMMEGNAYAKTIGKMFDHVDGEYVVARRLASMAQAYGFDGWLLNIETEFPYAVQNPISNLTAFIRNLKRLLGASRNIIWYDAITKANDVDYQNALTWRNVEFALAADAFFTNYKWTEQQLHESDAVAEQHGIKKAEVYFGIDVWAQNTNMPGPPRVTYPPNGGGGTLTGLAAHVLAREGFSTAIFAPAWPYEHFSSVTPVPSAGAAPDAPECEEYSRSQNTWVSWAPGPVAAESEAVAVERAMWEGTGLPDELSCDCKDGHPHHRLGYREMPITRASREYPAGSALFLETNFQLAFRPMLDGDGISYKGECLWIPNLGSQAPLPHIWQQQDPLSPTLDAEFKHHGSSFLQLSLHVPTSAQRWSSSVKVPEGPRTVSLSLFKTNFTTDAGLEVAVDLELPDCVPAVPGLSMGFYTKSMLQGSGKLKTTDYELPRLEGSSRQNAVFALDAVKPHARIVELGIYCSMACDIMGPFKVLDLYGLVIRPRVEAAYACSVAELEIYRRSSGVNSEQRLRWAWRGSRDTRPVGFPWSDTTGPFSFFTIKADDKVLGQAHCLEYPLEPGDRLQGEDSVEFSVHGHLFGGGVVCSSLIAGFSEGEDYFVRKSKACTG